MATMSDHDRAATSSSSTFSFLRPRTDPFHGGSPPPPPSPPTSSSSSPHPIRWRKGELIGAGAFGRVYMGMNLDSGELLAVKQVLIAANSVAKEKAQAHVRELEEEVKLLRNLSHPNIVRYLGTAREDDALNIFLEFVPGGSIASLLGKFGVFPEPVVRRFTRQLLQGLEYLHKNGIMHRDIKGANILVDNKGRIKLADFGASKQVVELVTLSGAKSMKGTPYWMAPEVIRQTGHSLPADIWSVGCTIIEMATGKPPWSQQFQEVAALFHIGTTKSHPPIPEHLSHEAQDFLLKCLKKEPHLRPTATELLQHAFVSRGFAESEGLKRSMTVSASTLEQAFHETKVLDSCKRRQVSTKPLEESLVRRSLAFCRKTLMREEAAPELEVDRSQDRSFLDADQNCSVRLDSIQFDDFMTKSFNKSSPFKPAGEPAWEQSSFNPMAEPTSYNPVYDEEPSSQISDDLLGHEPGNVANSSQAGAGNEADFSFQCMAEDTADDDEEEVTESKIKAFLDEKALELKRLQTPLYMEYQSIWNVSQQHGDTTVRAAALAKGTDSAIAPLSPVAAGRQHLTVTKSRSPSKNSSFSGPSVAISSRESDGSVSSGSPGGGGNPSVNFDSHLDSPTKLHEWKGLLQETQQPLPTNPSTFSSAERQRQWKEELQKELEMRREEKRKLMRLAGGSPKASPNSKSCSPKEKTSQRPVISRLSCASPISRLQVQL